MPPGHGHEPQETEHCNIPDFASTIFLLRPTQLQEISFHCPVLNSPSGLRSGSKLRHRSGFFGGVLFHPCSSAFSPPAASVRCCSDLLPFQALASRCHSRPYRMQYSRLAPFIAVAVIFISSPTRTRNSTCVPAEDRTSIARVTVTRIYDQNSNSCQLPVISSRVARYDTATSPSSPPPPRQYVPRLSPRAPRSTPASPYPIQPPLLATRPPGPPPRPPCLRFCVVPPVPPKRVW